MNIFALDYNPYNAARMLCDKHSVKMVLESMQLLSSFARDCGYDVGYKRAHAGHPCSIWIRLSDSNLQWFLNYCEALFQEYQFRRHKVHASMDVYNEIKNIVEWPRNIPDLEIKKPSQDVINWLEKLHNESKIDRLIFTRPTGSIKIKFNEHYDGDQFIDFYPAMPVECRIGKNSVEMYKNYYRTAKKDIVSYNWKPERGEWYEATR